MKLLANQPVPRWRSLLSSSRWQGLAGGLLIALLCFLIYAPALRGAFVLDDDILLTNSAFIHAPDGLYRFWLTAEPIDYYPLSNSLLWLEWRLWGMNSTGYHVVNVLMHAVTVIILWRVLRRLAIPGALVAALLFAVHPLNVESVAWIAQCKGMLALLLFVLSAYAFVRAEGGDDARPRWSSPWYAVAVLSGILAMLSKSSVVILPLALLVMIGWRRRVNGHDLLRVSPLIVAGALLAAVNVWFKLRETGFRPAGFTERLLGAAGTVWFYLYKALLPLDLAFIYPQWHIQVAEPRWWLPLAGVAGVTILLSLFFRSWGRPVLLAWIYFVVCLIPVMGFTDVGFMKQALVANHYAHAALLGVVTLVAALLGSWRGTAPQALIHPAWMLAAFLIAGLAALSWQEAKHFEGPLPLYRAAIAKNPDQWLAHTNLGIELSKLGRLSEAIEQYQEALRVNPDYTEARANLALALVRNGQVDESIAQYQEALRLRPESPDILTYLGAVLAGLGRTDEALAHYEEALRLAPDFPDAHYNRAVLLTQQGDLSLAVSDFQAAARWWPERFEVHQNLGIALVKANRLEEAVSAFREALRLNPYAPEAHYNLALVLGGTGRGDEAIEHYRAALRLRPDYPAAQRNLDTLLASGQNTQPR